MLNITHNSTRKIEHSHAGISS